MMTSIAPALLLSFLLTVAYPLGTSVIPSPAVWCFLKSIPCQENTEHLHTQIIPAVQAIGKLSVSTSASQIHCCY